jgi:hypothetical protein
MKRSRNTPKKLVVTIKNKWTNSSRVVTLNKFADVQLAHKHAYYMYTTNLEDIVSITDSYKNKLFTLKTGFRR